MADAGLGWWSWIAPASLLATPLLAFVWLVDRALRGRVWPQLLTTLWIVALARLVLPPTLGSPWSVTAALGSSTLEVSEGVPPEAPLAGLALLWLVGVGVCLGARAWRRRVLARRIVGLAPGTHVDWRAALARTADALGVARLPRLGTLAGLATPAVSGLLRPVLLVPHGALARTPTRHDENALLHELAHLSRRDLWLDEAGALVRALFWFHPLVWIAVGRLRVLGELACDATVARTLGAGARGYRDTLLLAARDLLGLCDPPGVRAFAGHPSALRARLEHLRRLPSTPIAVVRALGAGLAVVLCACVLPMAPAAAFPLALRASARGVIAANARGERQSCFQLHAAASVLAAHEPESPGPESD